MSLISIEFLLIVLITFILIYLLPKKYHWLIFLGMSLIYFFESAYQILIITSSVFLDYLIANKIAKVTNNKIRKGLLYISIILNLGLLFIDKYAFWLSSHQTIFPIGLSFFIIIKIGYMVDVYTRREQAPQNFGFLFTFSTFFLTVSSGPIERAKHLIPQLRLPADFDLSRIILGLRRILFGLFKKLIIADGLARAVDTVYGEPGNFSGPFLIIATVIFAFQLYADFSGYTDIVLGIGKIFGIELFENFRQPYFATSILDFWKRWHISLSNWIREFMFFPLSRYLLGQKFIPSKRLIQAFVYIVVMGIVGIWHGSDITFLIWGGLHGIYMTIEMLLPTIFKNKPQNAMKMILRTLITFVQVCFAWIWFRAESFADGWYIVTHLFKSGNFPQEISIFSENSLLFAIIGVIILICFDFIEVKMKFENRLDQLPTILRWGIYYSLFIPVVLKLLNNPVITDFVYFRF